MNRSQVSPAAALEETFFLGLRLTGGVNLRQVAAAFGEDAIAGLGETIAELRQMGLMEKQGDIDSSNGEGPASFQRSV